MHILWQTVVIYRPCRTRVKKIGWWEADTHHKSGRSELIRHLLTLLLLLLDKANNKASTFADHLQLVYSNTCPRVFLYIIFFSVTLQPNAGMASSLTRFLDHTQRCITVGRAPLNEWSARSRDLYLTTHNTHNRQTSMPPVGFETTISAGERPQTAQPFGPAFFPLYPH